MGSDLVTISQSNLPAEAKKSALMRAWSGIKGGGIKRVESSAVEAGHAVRAGGESLLVGGILGLVHASRGLDVDDTPIDGVVGGLGLLGGILFPSVGPDLRQIGATSLGILSFRKVHDWAHAKNVAKGEAIGTPIGKAGATSKKKLAQVAGEHEVMSDGMGEDPIVELAKSL
jgi:hypothetical protein